MICEEIKQKIKYEILSGKYKKREKLPSIRKFADQEMVNPNTMQKILKRLQTEGIIINDRGGKRVNPDLDIEKMRLEEATRNSNLLVSKLQLMGYSKGEVCKLIKKYLMK